MAEADASQASYVPWYNPGVAWETPTNPTAAGVNPFGSAGTTDLDGEWTAGVSAPIIPDTYYSHQTGPWNQASTWTHDPGGTTQNATDFPKIPEVEDAYDVNIPSDVLGSAVSNTLFATSTDELRPAMTGVFVNLNEDNSTFVATDGHRLIRYLRSDVNSPTKSSLIIPRKALSLLKSALPTDTTQVTVQFNVSNVFFKFNNIQLICRLIDERYPDYENVIPQNNDNEMTINRLELLSSLKRIAIYANKTTHQVRLKISGNELHISAEDLDFSNEANEKLNCEHQGEDIEIGFNARFLIEMLNNLDADEVMLKLSAPNRAGLIVPKESDADEDVLMLVMPVMLNNYA